MVTVCCVAIDAGATYAPVWSMDPVPTGLMDHTTDGFEAFVTIAVNFWAWFALSVALEGETVTEIDGARVTVADVV